MVNIIHIRTRAPFSFSEKLCVCGVDFQAHCINIQIYRYLCIGWLIEFAHVRYWLCELFQMRAIFQPLINAPVAVSTTQLIVWIDFWYWFFRFAVQHSFVVDIGHATSNFPFDSICMSARNLWNWSKMLAQNIKLNIWNFDNRQTAFHFVWSKRHVGSCHFIRSYLVCSRRNFD